MGGFFSKPSPPPAPDTSYLDEQRKDREEEKDKLDRQNQAKIRARRQGGGGRSALLFGTEKGVTPNSKGDKLGG